MVPHCAGRLPISLSHGFMSALLIWTSQAREFSPSSSRHQVQEIPDAIRPDGKYISLPPSMRATSAEPPRTRSLLDRRPL